VDLTEDDDEEAAEVDDIAKDLEGDEKQEVEEINRLAIAVSCYAKSFSKGVRSLISEQVIEADFARKEKEIEFKLANLKHVKVCALLEAAKVKAQMKEKSKQIH
jgi:hypothetical protein